MKVGTKVLAYPNAEERVGFFLGSADSGKDSIQVGADTHDLAYREPADYDENGSGGTYRKLN